MTRKALLNAKSVDSQKPMGKQFVIWDSHIKNFGLRVSAKGQKAWVLVYRINRRQRWLTLGHYPDVTLADARSRAESARGELANGKDPAAAKDANRRAGTFEELARDYLQKHAKPKKREKTWREDERVINRELLPHWKYLKVNEIRRHDVRRLIDGIVERGAPTMGNRTLALVKSIFFFGISEDWLEANPTTGLRFPAKENRRDRVLSELEIHDVWHALERAPERVASALRFQLLTGQRISEVLTMRWEDIELRKRRWLIPRERTKNGRAHQVPLSNQTLKVLQQCEKYCPALPTGERTGWVLPSSKASENSLPLGTVHHALGRLCESLEIEFRTHDLRRTVATSLAAAGVSQTVLGKILNHTEITVTARHYDWHAYEREKQAALDAWGHRIEQLVTGKREAAPVVPFPMTAG